MHSVFNYFSIHYWINALRHVGNQILALLRGSGSPRCFLLTISRSFSTGLDTFVGQLSAVIPWSSNQWLVVLALWGRSQVLQEKEICISIKLVGSQRQEVLNRLVYCSAGSGLDKTLWHMIFMSCKPLLSILKQGLTPSGQLVGWSISSNPTKILLVGWSCAHVWERNSMRAQLTEMWSRRERNNAALVNIGREAHEVIQNVLFSDCFTVVMLQITWKQHILVLLSVSALPSVKASHPEACLIHQSVHFIKSLYHLSVRICYIQRAEKRKDGSLSPDQQTYFSLHLGK